MAGIGPFMEQRQQGLGKEGKQSAQGFALSTGMGPQANPEPEVKPTGKRAPAEADP